MRRIIVAGTAAVLATLAPYEAAGAGLAFIRASSQLEEAVDPGRYHPLNLLDEDPETVWCAAPADDGGEGQSIDIVFKAPQRIVRLVVTPAKMGPHVASVRVSDGARVVTVELGEEPAELVPKKPLNGDSFQITIATLGDRTGAGDKPACLADVLLYTKTGLFGSGAKHSGIRYNANLARLLGSWNGGPLGAPEKELVFALDGTWDWTYRPLLGGKEQHKSGEFRLRGDRLLMRFGEAGRWADMGLRIKRVKVDLRELGAPSADYDSVRLNGALGFELGGEYSNARFD